MTDDAPAWSQVNIAFADWNRAEQAALTHLAPMMRAAEDDGALDAWFFIRKRPCWRVRYLPVAGNDAQTPIEQRLDELVAARHIEDWTRIVYEPEVHAFGGPQGMAAAHRLFHRDSRCLLDHLQPEYGPRGGHRRELSVMLCSILMRAANQDWYEQGDIWARVAAHRAQSALGPDASEVLPAAVHRLMTVDAESQMRPGAPLAHACAWAAAYSTAGRELADLATTGALRRGLRDILAHHVIFAWNRLGLSYTVQSVLAATAQSVVFGPDPRRRVAEGAPWTARQPT
jgi:thiopeptide-type bacteriocin biosynthesis protein